MVVTATDATSLKLALGEQNDVWFLDGEGLPVSSNLSLEAFVRSDVCRRADHVRVIGSIRHASMLLALYERKRSGHLDRLEVCSPLCAAPWSDCQMMLFRMRSYQLPSTVGGWHEFDGLDYPSYALAKTVAGVVTESDVRFLRLHPAWPSLTFIASISPERCCRLIGTLLDPRWYVDPNRPERTAKIEQYLGLTPKVQAALDKGTKNSAVHQRCRLVLSCWKSDEPEDWETNPRHFLWRAYHKRGGGFRGDLAASKLFVSYLRQVWMTEIVQLAFRGRLFVPEHFFHNQDEVLAYQRYVSHWTQT